MTAPELLDKLRRGSLTTGEQVEAASLLERILIANHEAQRLLLAEEGASPPAQ